MCKRKKKENAKNTATNLKDGLKQHTLPSLSTLLHPHFKKFNMALKIIMTSMTVKITVIDYTF